MRHRTALIAKVPGWMIFLGLFWGVTLSGVHGESSSVLHEADHRLAINLAELPPLPANVEGAFVATINQTVIVAGGVHPSSDPRVPGQLDFVHQVYVLRPNSPEWELGGIQVSAAFGATAQQGDSLYCIGGLGPEGLLAQVVEIKLTGPTEEGAIASSGRVTLEVAQLPDLPVATAFAGASVLNNRLHVIGGITAIDPVDANARHLILPLVDPKTTPAVRQVWGNGVDVPAVTSVVAPVVVVRRDATLEEDMIYLAGGWRYDGATERFLPLGKAWRLRDGEPVEPGSWAPGSWTEVAAPPSGVVFRSGMPLGPSHWLLLGRMEAGERNSLAELCTVPRGPAGFFTYHVYTDTWVKLPWQEQMLGVTLAGKGKGFVMVGALDAAETRGQVRWGQFKYQERHFQSLDFTVMVVYMLSLIVIGFWCSRKENDTTEFFLGSRNIPWWAAGLSMYATGISAISFMAIPAKTYATNWVRLGEPLIAFFSMMAAGYIFVPLLRRLNLTTMMEYLELRFNKVIRFLFSVMAIAGQVAGRMGVVLLLPSLALSAVTGMNVYYAVMFMGVVATLYTVLGGIRAVIWTDVLQFFVLFGGALLCLVMIMVKVDGGFAGMIDLGQQYGKFHTFDFSWDFTSVTVWVVMLWGIGDVFSRLGQENMQRAFATKGASEARKAMMTCAVVSVPGALLFFLVGAALFAFYHLNPQFLNPTLQTDAVLPLFVAQQLPAGIGGLVIAGLFAAAMSTLDSAMNTVATIVTRDWYAVFQTDTPESTRLLVARVITVACGVAGTLTALYMASIHVESLWDGFSKIMGLIGGAVAGILALALLTRRANWLGALLGAGVNALLLTTVKAHLHFLTWGLTFMVIGAVTGYIFSLLIDAFVPKDVRKDLGLTKDLTGLTIWTPRPDAS